VPATIGGEQRLPGGPRHRLRCHRPAPRPGAPAMARPGRPLQRFV